MMISDGVESLPIEAGCGRRLARPLAILAASRLRACGYALVVLYAVFAIFLFRSGYWLTDSAGTPILNDFTTFWLAGTQALHGNAASLYDPAEYAKIQSALVGPEAALYLNWSYPPVFLLLLAPFALLPYIYAFMTWSAVTLAVCLAVVYLILRRPEAIILVLASPLTLWNLCAAQAGCLSASLLGAALLFLERRPVLAGVFAGCLGCKPQFGILLPVAFAAARQWRAFASAAATAGLLVVASIAVFGTAAWEEFPRELAAQANVASSLAGGWGRFQTVYGLIRELGAGPAPAWLAQGTTAAGAATIVWLLWRSPTRYALKAAALSAAALIATPYGFAYDMAAIVIPAAFLASDQMHCGLLRGEQTIMIALFVACLVIPGSLGTMPLGPAVMITLLGVILRRALNYGEPLERTSYPTRKLPV